MLLDLDQGRLIVFLAGLSLIALIESRFSHRAHSGYVTWRWLMHLGIAGFNTLLMRALVFVPLLLWLVHCQEQGWGLARVARAVWLGGVRHFVSGSRCARLLVASLESSSSVTLAIPQGAPRRQ